MNGSIRQRLSVLPDADLFVAIAAPIVIAIGGALVSAVWFFREPAAVYEMTSNLKAVATR